jgi:hypothetical protein
MILAWGVLFGYCVIKEGWENCGFYYTNGYGSIYNCCKDNLELKLRVMILSKATNYCWADKKKNTIFCELKEDFSDYNNQT